MNNLRREITEQDRKYVTLARLLKVSKSHLNYKIDHDVFSEQDKAIAAEWLKRPIAELFPEQETVKS